MREVKSWLVVVEAALRTEGSMWELPALLSAIDEGLGDNKERELAEIDQ